jgi:hypothetical protein
VAFSHHSNLGAILPSDTVRTHWRGEDVTADLVKQEFDRIDTGCTQELQLGKQKQRTPARLLFVDWKTVPTRRYMNYIYDRGDCFERLRLSTSC